MSSPTILRGDQTATDNGSEYSLTPDAAVMVLRIDDVIAARAGEGGGKGAGKGGDGGEGGGDGEEF